MPTSLLRNAAERRRGQLLGATAVDAVLTLAFAVVMVTAAAAFLARGFENGALEQARCVVRKAVGVGAQCAEITLRAKAPVGSLVSTPARAQGQSAALVCDKLGCRPVSGSMHFVSATPAPVHEDHVVGPSVAPGFKLDDSTRRASSNASASSTGGFA